MKNPIMFYMHDREKGIIGRWDNMRIDGVKLLADAVFDESTPLGKEVKTRVDGGFLRSASIGINTNTHETMNGVDTVTDCELFEVSIVDIPSNQNAVKLRDKNGRVYLSLKDLEQSNDDLKARIIEVLKLPAMATTEQILNAIAALSASAESGSDKALRFGYIEPSQITMLQLLERTDKLAFTQFMQNKEKETAAQINKELEIAISKGKFITYERDVFQNIGKQLGISVLKQVLSVLPEKRSLADWFRPENKDKMNPDNWGLDEYRKYNPQALQDDPELYARLRAQKNGDDFKPAYDLAYYRKHDPEYLAKHPDQYKKLLARKNTNNQTL